MFGSVDEVKKALAGQNYLADCRLATILYLAYHLQKPILVEGPAGVGKTQLAKSLAQAMKTELIRLQCYEGLDESKALYEWNYQKQLLNIHAFQATGRDWESTKQDIFSAEYCLPRPLLRALQAPKQVVLLVDELDKSDEEFESFLLEALADYQVTIPEMGTVKASTIPLVILTSNNYREFSDALKRRCLHLYIDYPTQAGEIQILKLHLPDLSHQMAEQITGFVRNLRKLNLKKPPSISESLDWARTLIILNSDVLSEEIVAETLSVVLKHRQDVQKVEERLQGLLQTSV